MIRAALVAAVALFALPARAGTKGDGAYGRLDGDMTFVVGAGAGFVARSDRPIASGDLRLRYLDAAGVSLVYEESHALSPSREPGDLRRAFLAGVELRPLFPVRFLKNRQTGSSFFDLTFDSLAIDVGAIFAARHATSVQRPGVYLGLALELPVMARATGLWVRLATNVRWSAPRLEGAEDPGGRVVVFSIGVAWHQIFSSGATQKGDEALQ